MEEGGPYSNSWFNMKYWKTIAFAAYIAYLTSLFIPFTGITTKVNQYNTEACIKVKEKEELGFESCEDFFLFEGAAYVACDPFKLTPSAREGAIWKVNYKEKPAIIEKFIMSEIMDFHPLGIRLDIHPHTGEKTLVVINIPINKNKPSVELFSMDENKLQLIHKKTIQHPLLYTPNSIHIIHDSQFRAEDGTPSFFFTNDHYFTNDLLKLIETLLVPWSNVGFYNARTDNVEKGVQGLWFANGLSGTDNTLLVTETYKRDIKQYDIIMVDNKIQLHFIKEIKFNMAVDNIVYYPDKHVAIVAGHPKPLNVARYAATKDKSIEAGSQVDVWNLNTDETKTLLQDNGSFYRGSTAVSIDFNSTKMIVSSILDQGILVCNL